MLKIYIYDYLNRIPSSRRLERECQRNIEGVWLTEQLLDHDKDFQEEVRNAAFTLMEAVEGKRKGLLVEGSASLKERRPK